MENKRYAPIVIFAFNRVEVINKLIDSLLTNAEALESDLYVYVDGPRDNKHEDSFVRAVQDCVKNIKGFFFSYFNSLFKCCNFNIVH